MKERLSMTSYNGHLSHGHTYKLKKKIYGSFVLTKAPKGKEFDEKEAF